MSRVPCVNEEMLLDTEKVFKSVNADNVHAQKFILTSTDKYRLGLKTTSTNKLIYRNFDFDYLINPFFNSLWSSRYRFRNNRSYVTIS